jgi:uncharacterized protein (DUF2235 family)
MAFRNLIIGCDGTWKDTDGSPTNVIKLLRACSAKNQITHYEEGVGSAHLEALPGGIYGANLDRQILGGYRFLRRRFQDTDWSAEDNKLFIFGFSRGSYAARRLAGLISFSGIPKKSTDVDLGWQMYLQQDFKSIKALKEQDRFFDHPIEVLGVWDTVKTTTDADLHDRKLPKCVVAGYHGMAINEMRKLFPILKWNSDSRVRQVWFTGVHADVGGGYKKSGLSDIPLQWMVDSAYGHGLALKASEMKKLKKDPNGELHESHKGIWKALGKKIRTITKTALIHSSVKIRMQSGYAPPNLPDSPNFVDL